jgi:hypothetical protein
LAKIPQAGGEINFIVIPEPIEKMVTNGYDNNCWFTFEQAAEQLSLYIISTRSQFPKAKIGIFEPLRGYSAGPYPHKQGSHHHGEFTLIFERVLKVLKSHDETIDFFHMTSPNELELFFPEYPSFVYWRIGRIGDYLRSRGIRYGVIYFSQQGGEESDIRFFEDVLHIKEFIIRTNRDYDNFILQSFLGVPSKCLPENETYTYTNLINEFEEITSAPTRTPQPADDYVWDVDVWCEQHVGCEKMEVKNQTDFWVNIVLKSQEFWGATKMFSIPPRGNSWLTLKPGSYHYTFTYCGGEFVDSGYHNHSSSWYLEFRQEWCE